MTWERPYSLPQYSGYVSIFKQLSNQSIKTFYKGIFPTLIYSSLQSAWKFQAFSALDQYIKASDSDISKLSRLSGVLMTSCVIGNFNEIYFSNPYLWHILSSLPNLTSKV